jgi:protein-S-isoprenylcysteine O-methyltransferase Ste14
MIERDRYGGFVKLNLGTLLIAGLFLLYLGWQGRNLPWTPMRIAGAAILIPAFLLLVVARLQLGRAFSVRAKATTLVTTGRYSRIRNPIYLFGSLVIAGIILWASKPIYLLIFVAIVPVQIYRIRREEQVLAEEFGAAYLEYRRKTWF